MNINAPQSPLAQLNASKPSASNLYTHAATHPTQTVSLDIFCNVIDNYGDAGVCLHLARALSLLNYQVKLWCNNMAVLQTLTIPADHSNPHLNFASWEQELKAYQPAQVVISAFSCHLDQCTRTALRQHPETLNINLEYLSAEDWVESCHTLPSPQDGYTSYFFFPGFTAQTGGLNVDQSFITACRHEQQQQRQLMSPSAPPPQQQQLQQQQIPFQQRPPLKPRVISLFGYDNPTVLKLINSLQKSSRPSLIKVFTGLALDNLNQLLQLKLQVGDRYQDRQVTIEVLPMLTHEEYDQILLHSDFNLVRGEDSIVRAIHTGHPFLWQIYPQDEDTHIVKLQSFLDQVQRINLEIAEQATNTTTIANNANGSANDYDKSKDEGKCENDGHTAYLPQEPAEFASAFAHFSQVMLAYNGSGAWPEDFDFDRFTQDSTTICYNLASYLCAQEPLAVRLAKFIAQKLQQP